MDSTWREGDVSRSVAREPEILPPGATPEPPQAYYYRPVQPPPRPRRRWAFAPATYVLVGINCLVFLGMLLTGVSMTSPTPEQLLVWGADYGPFVLVLGQWWRLVTAMFVHVGLLHLATNMWCLWNLGLLGEPLLGPFGMFAAYLLTGIAGNLLSTAVHPGVHGGPQGIVGAGASGAVFGLAGVLIILLKSPLLPLPQAEVGRLRRSVIWFAVLNFVIGAGTWVARTRLQIDNMAHLGGFLSGLAFGIPLVPRIGAARAQFLRRRWIATVGMTFLLLLLCFGVRSFWRG
ncbi:rhomboid family intramembrane serine protease [Acidipila rosea]|uniref:Rhomboid protease GluP n=1 Tax=Acidipila rosea TaxID=768535 RepID=A0A4R1LB09_9BACT|nr:rhomboid family intramembrane serine protease [Acidipila rosea]TCK75364.1 rhomboid protease GluP [Acidipila rosea]